MGEFASQNRRRAADLLRTQFHQEPTPETDPLIELAVSLLEDGAGGVIPELPVTTDKWLTWNQLAAEQPKTLAQAVTEVLEAEQLELPEKELELREWAASLLLNTLDRFETR